MQRSRVLKFDALHNHLPNEGIRPDGVTGVWLGAGPGEMVEEVEGEEEVTDVGSRTWGSFSRCSRISSTSGCRAESQWRRS